MYLDKHDLELVGVVGVDSGSLIIADPCYILEDTEGQVPDHVTYQELMTMWEKDNWKSDFLEPRGNGMGLVCGGWGGDGVFNVYARRRHGRVAQIVIDFGYDDDEMDDGLVQDEP